MCFLSHKLHRAFRLAIFFWLIAGWSGAAGEMSVEEAETLVRQGDAASESAAALDAYQTALSVFREAESLPNVCGTLLRIGQLYADHHDYQRAETALKEAISIAETLERPLLQALNLQALGDAYVDQSRLSDAVSAYESASRILSEARGQQAGAIKHANLLLYEVYARASLANAHTRLGQYGQANTHYQHALDLLKPYEHDEDVHYYRAAILRDYGVSSWRVGQYAHALKLSHEALDIFRAQLTDDATSDSAGMVENIATVLTAIVGMYAEFLPQNTAYLLDASRVYQEAAEIVPTSKAADTRAALYANIGELLDTLGTQNDNSDSLHAALQFHQQAFDLYQTLPYLDMRAKALTNLGKTHLHLSAGEHRADHLAQADTFLRKALALQETADRSRLWMTFSLLSAVAEAQGERGDALDAARQSIDLLERMTRDAGVSRLKISLRDQAEDAYRRMIRLSMQQAATRPQAFEYSERARARAFLDLLASKEQLFTHLPESIVERYTMLRRQLAEQGDRLERLSAEADLDAPTVARAREEFQKLQADYDDLLKAIRRQSPADADTISVETMTLEEVQAHLDAQSTLLSYFMTPQATYAFVIGRDSFQAIELPITEAALWARVNRIRDSASPLDLLMRDLQRLHAHLIAPLLPRLRTRHLIIVPHGVLHYLPFAALTDGTRYVSDEYTLTFLPAAGMLRFLRPGASQQRTLLAFANNTAPNLPTLRHAEEEAQVMARYVPGQVFLGKEATESRLKRLAGGSSLLLLAGHGLLDRAEPLRSTIFLRGDAEDDGHLTVEEIYDLDLRGTEVVVLSACETKLGKHSKGDDMIGLTRAFLHAGAQAVISSVWSVPDAATYELMTEFSRRLKSGDSQAEALQAAQRRVRKQYPHPYYWAGFALTGNPGHSSAFPLLFGLPIWLGVGGILTAVLGSVVFLSIRSKQRRIATGDSA